MQMPLDLQINFSTTLCSPLAVRLRMRGIIER